MSQKQHFQWSMNGSFEYDGPTAAFLLMESVNPNTRVGVTSLKKKIRETRLGGFNNNVRTMLNSIQSDYTEVYFSLAKQYELKEEEIYIYGKFNNYALTQENKMIYNPSLEVYEGILLLKQGFYNYKYLEVIDGEPIKNSISGNHSQTENLYTVLVYHRGIGELYDALIGIGQAQSFALKR